MSIIAKPLDVASQIAYNEAMNIGEIWQRNYVQDKLEERAVTTIIVGVVVSLIVILGLTFWVTKKAYSRKWDEED